MRTLEVLVDRGSVASGTAATGEPWQHHDLGHGYCSYTFFEQCPHRMACVHCDFYTPKTSSADQLIEAKDNLQRMLVDVPLTDDERTAVNDGQPPSSGSPTVSPTPPHRSARPTATAR